MRTGLALTGYAAVSLETGNGGSPDSSGHGRLVLVTGRVTGFRMVLSLPAADRVPTTLVNNIVYAQLPHPTKRGTTFTVLSISSNRVSVRRLAKGVATVTTESAPATVFSLVEAASRLTFLGRSTVDGTPVLRYRMTARTAKIARSDALRGVLEAKDTTSVALTVSVDGRGRPVRARYDLGGNGSDTEVTYSSFNQPFALSAPPQDEVDTGS